MMNKESIPTVKPYTVYQRLNSTLCTLGLALALLASGCQPEASETDSGTAARPSHAVFHPPSERLFKTQTTEGQRFVVSYQSEPDPIPLNAHFRLTFSVQEAQSKQPPGEALALQLDADMPEHNHGMNVQPVVRSLGGGRFEVQGLLFHMAGYWELKLTLLPAGQPPEQAVFGVQVEMKPTQAESAAEDTASHQHESR